ncbi:MAG: regulatory protein RecX [Terriglobia bacterium]
MSAAASANRRYRPPQRLAETQLYEYALGSLSRHAQSTAELRQRLVRRAAEPPAVAAVLQRLTAAGLLDDRRFALQFATYAAGAKRFGHYRIAWELRRKGVAEEFIAAALAEVFPAERDEAALVRARLERRLRSHRPPYPKKVLRSAYRSLLRAGFSSAIILRELRRPEVSGRQPLEEPFPPEAESPRAHGKQEAENK